MSKIMTKLQDIITPAVNALGFELYGCQLTNQSGRPTLVIYVDQVTLDDCANISRQVAAVLDVSDPIKGRYQLEVSSPGIDRPLFTSAHYQDAIGKWLKVRLRTPLQGSRNFKGVLEKVTDDDQVHLRLENNEVVTFALAVVDKSKILSDL